MKTKSSLILFLSFALTFPTLYAQVPQGIKYQTVIRDAAGNPLASQPVNLTLSILQGSTSGTSVCTENFSTTTNEFGLANLVIGSENPTAFQAINWESMPYFVKVEVDGVYIGTSELLSVPYSLYSGKSKDSYWSKSGNSIYYIGGKVGIGTDLPSSALALSDDGVITFGDNPYAEGMSFGSLRAVYNNDESSHGVAAAIDFIRPVNVCNGNEGQISFKTNFGDASGQGSLLQRMVINRNGNIGIGCDNPVSKLDVTGDISLRGALTIDLQSFTGPGGRDALYLKSSLDNAESVIITNRTKFALWSNQTQHLADLECGNTTVKVLQITGGSDFAEPFPIKQTLAVGSVVVIDENNPGQLIESTLPYDKKVAGIVSGAGGIQPGLTLKQEGVMEGSQNIALSGRVYVLATTENGAIKPGDRLTTSSLAGHAMKATDSNQWDGAVIGKAMSGLENGEGLVLVLVNLQ